MEHLESVSNSDSSLDSSDLDASERGEETSGMYEGGNASFIHSKTTLEEALNRFLDS